MARRIITAKRAVNILQNCTVNLYIDGGVEKDGRWQSERTLIGENVGATKQRAKASQIARFERGGERKEGWSRLFLDSEPSQAPDWVETGGEMYKVYDVDFRPSRVYFAIIMAREL